MPVRGWSRIALVISCLSLASSVTPPEECFPVADVVFLVDGSDSISDEEFLDQKTFIRRFVEMSNIGPEAVRVGFAVVSTAIKDTLNLTSGSEKKKILTKVDSMTHQQEGSRTDVGIVYIDNMFFTQGRLGTMYIGVILTDGRPKYKTATEAEAAVAKNSGVFLITIGVGRNIQDDVLKRIASTPSNSYHMQPMNFSLTLLTETVKYLGKEWCSDVVTGLPPISEEILKQTDADSSSRNLDLSDSVFFLSKYAENKNSSINEPLSKQKNLPSLSSTQSRELSVTSKTKAPFPQTTVYPVTRNNLGKILRALVNSKRAKSQGIAFVKSRKDLIDALKILFVSRALGFNNFKKTADGFTETDLGSTGITTIPLVHVLPTIKPTIKVSLELDKKLTDTKVIRTPYEDSITGSQGQYLQKIVKATQPSIFKQATFEKSSKSKQPEREHFTNGTTLSASHGETVVKPSVTSIEMFTEAFVDRNLFKNNTAGQTTERLVNKMETKPPDIELSPVNVKSQSASTADKTRTQISESSHVSLKGTPAGLGEFIRTRLALLNRGQISPSVSFFKPFNSQITSPDKSPGWATETEVFETSVKQQSKSVQRESVIKQNVDKETKYDSAEAGNKTSAIVRRKNESEPLHWMDQSTTVSPTSIVYETTKQMQRQEDKLVEYNFKEMTKGLDSNIAFIHGTADSRPFYWINQSVPGSRSTTTHRKTKPTKLRHDTLDTGQEILKRKVTLYGPENTSDASRSDIVTDIRMIQKPVTHFSLLPLSPVSIFSDTGRMSFSVLRELNSSQSGNTNPTKLWLPRVTTPETTHAPNLKSKSQLLPQSQSRKNMFEINTLINTSSTAGISFGKGKYIGREQSNVKNKIQPFKSPGGIPKLQYTEDGLKPSEMMQVPKELRNNDNGHHDGHYLNESVLQTVTFSEKVNNVSEKIIIKRKEHNLTLDKTAILDLCLKSRYVDGIGYAHKAQSCTDFLQCIQINGHIKVEVGHCPVGTVFDETFVVCRPYDRHICPRDPCSDHYMPLKYGHPSNCRGYWNCVAGRSIPGCCPKGFSYSAAGICVPDLNCTDPCLETTVNCNTSSFKTNDKFYFENFPGHGWVIRMCPMHSRYVPDRCGCQSVEEFEAKVECRPQVSLDFEDNTLYRGSVKIVGGVGKFEGMSMITLWRFTGVSFGTSVLITMRFKIPEPEQHNGKLMHLLSNCCIGCRGRPGPTIDIAVLPDTSGGVVVVSSYSSTSGEKFVFIPYEKTTTGWNTLSYSYDGSWLVGTVNGITARQQMKGSIESRPYPLLLGSCGMVPSFRGYIDDFKIYLCKS